jgi:hypothetical protein
MLADEPDNRVLEAAAAGQADLIVTGDKPCRNSVPSGASPSSRPPNSWHNSSSKVTPSHPARAGRRPDLEVTGAGQGGLALLRHLAHWTGLTGLSRALSSLPMLVHDRAGAG